MEEYKDDIDEKCPICSDNLKSPTPTFVCSHVFCQECIVTWYKNCVYNHKPTSCPICRKIDNIWGADNIQQNPDR
jgi:hypothetical protein